MEPRLTILPCVGLLLVPDGVCAALNVAHDRLERGPVRDSKEH